MSLRIYELAKEFNVDSNKVVKVLKNSGWDIKNHLSSIDANIGRKIVKEVLVDKVEAVIEDKIDDFLEPVEDFIPDTVEEKIDEVVGEISTEIVEEVLEVVEDVKETMEEFNERRKIEIADETAKILEREKEEVTKKYTESKQERMEK